MKEYIKPEIKVRNIEIENEILAASVNGGPNEQMNTTDDPITDDNNIGAKQNFLDWDDEEN